MSLRRSPGRAGSDRVLRPLARKAPDDAGWVETDEAAAPAVTTLLDGLRDGDVEGVRALVRTTPTPPSPSAGC
ncbi:hypothetical protein ACIQNI_10635 [Streptomyces sp. NPDC091266]|uniref:hypothetical protein n=1 Tax=Streptomyces sp. NPDC091266 TaxID=3365978 RepID=UPI00381DB79A